MFNFYATTEKGGTGKTNGGTGFAFCLYRGFSMLGKLGYLSLLPPVICFALMYFFGKRLNKVTQVRCCDYSVDSRAQHRVACLNARR